MSLTSAAVRRSRFTLVAALGLALAGLSVLFGYPSTEEPTVPVRVATVAAFWPNASPERQERLVARPLEEHIREIPEVEHIDTVVRSGFTFIYVNLRGDTAPDKLAGIWQRLKNKVADARSELPDGVSAPVVNDEYGRVAVRSLALTGAGFTAGQLQDWAKNVRERLQSVPGTEQIALYGVREERVYVELSPDKLAAAGLTPTAVAQALAARNVFTASGEIDAQGQTLVIEPGGDLPSVAELASVSITMPNGGTIPLSSLGRIEQRAEDPPTSAVVYNGVPAVVLGISMRTGLNVNVYAEALNAGITEVEKEIPFGMRLESITDQSVVVDKQLSEVGRVFIETVIIVLAVVIVFLGWRSGMVTGIIVPITVLSTLVLMKAAGIELHQVSIAAIIISLGLFVDNAIVIVEDFQRRAADGEDRLDAAQNAGRSMAAPLLTSTLAIILTFVPLVAGQNATAEYMRSLGIVVAMTLLLSLFLALTLTPLLSKMYAGGEGKSHAGEVMIARIRQWYVRKVQMVLSRPFLVIGTMVGLLISAAIFYNLLPQELLSASERAQIQIPIELNPGTSTRQTLALAAQTSKFLSDRTKFPELAGNAIYVGDGGPRFILGLNPPTPAANRAYAVVNVQPGSDLDETIERVRTTLARQFPAAKFEPKRFSLGSSDAGKAVFRLVGPERASLTAASTRLADALRRDPDMRNVATNAEGSIPYLSIAVNASQLTTAGVSHADISNALEAAYSGVVATALRQGSTMVPVILRAPDIERFSPERLSHLPVGGTNGIVRLGDVATVRLADQVGVLNRRDLFAAIEVTANSPVLTAQEIVDRMQGEITALKLPAGTHIEYGGELADSVEANQGLLDYLPLAVLGMAGLFLWQFGSVRKTLIILASIPFVLIGACVALWLTGQPVSFSATLGLLALGGIIVNNAVLLIERIQYEIDQGKPLLTAISDAAALRLRPILMTKLTCVLGLLPLFVFGGDLWRPLAATMIGGLALGTLVTLVLVPTLYAVAFRAPSRS